MRPGHTAEGSAGTAAGGEGGSAWVTSSGCGRQVPILRVKPLQAKRPSRTGHRARGDPRSRYYACMQGIPADMLQPAPATSLTPWRERAGSLPAALAEALQAAATLSLREAECGDTLDLLGMLGCDAQTQAAALWFELARSDPELWAARRAGLPTELQRLVAGQQAAEQVWALHAQRTPHGAAEGLRLLLAIVRDLRVVLVLLARQLARMRAAVALPSEQAAALARLSRDIHAPLANRLGIWQLKWELEDLAFRFLQPDTYRRIAKLLDERRVDREGFIRPSLDELQQALDAAGIRAELAGRPKHIYSIWKKMQRKSLDFSDLYDIRAVRVLVDSITDCYA